MEDYGSPLEKTYKPVFFSSQLKLKVIGKIPIPPHRIPARTIQDQADPDGIAVNPETHKTYVMDSSSGFVYAIESKRITAGDIKKCNSTPVKVGVGSRLEDRSIAVNPNTNMVYVTNPNNNTVSVIDGKTNNISVRINFKIGPPNLGYINCNGSNIHNITSSTYAMVDLGSLMCEAKAIGVFPSPFSLVIGVFFLQFGSILGLEI